MSISYRVSLLRMARVCASETWVSHQDWNTSTVYFTIHHIARVVAAAAGEITSKAFTIGGSTVATQDINFGMLIIIHL